MLKEGQSDNSVESPFDLISVDIGCEYLDTTSPGCRRCPWIRLDTRSVGGCSKHADEGSVGTTHVQDSSLGSQSEEFKEPRSPETRGHIEIPVVRITDCGGIHNRFEIVALVQVLQTVDLGLNTPSAARRTHKERDTVTSRVPRRLEGVPTEATAAVTEPEVHPSTLLSARRDLLGSRWHQGRLQCPDHLFMTELRWQAVLKHVGDDPG